MNRFKPIGRLLLLLTLITQVGFWDSAKSVKKKYERNAVQKALAVSDDGAVGAAWGHAQLTVAITTALQSCKDNSKKPDTCRISNINDREVTQEQVTEILSSAKKDASEKLKEAELYWTITEKTDRMTDEKNVLIVNNRPVSPDIPLNFPYKDTEARLIVGCDAKIARVFISFNNLNLSSNRVRVRSITGPENFTVSVDQGGAAAFFDDTDTDTILSRISDSESILVEFDHYGSGLRIYKFLTTGFRSLALRAVEMGCKP